MEKQPNELLPCLSGEEIARLPVLQPYLIQLKQLISAPLDIYQELYLATLNRFMAFCQAMSFDNQSKPYSLLQLQLDLAITALKLRRGKMLPLQSESETIAEQEPLWTYALFTACLFTQINHLQHDRTITLFKNGGNKLGLWHPLTGNLYEPATFYSFDNKSHPVIVSEWVFRAALIGRIVPSIALRWLTGCPTAFQVWWTTLVENPTAPTVLTEIIREAAEKINYPLDTDPPDDANPIIQKHQSPHATTDELEEKTNPSQLLNILNEWIDHQCSATDFNVENTLLLRVPAGLFIGIKRIAEFLQLYPQYAPQNNLLQLIDKYLVKENSSAIHRYRSARFEKRLVIEGIILDITYLPPQVKSLPLQSSFATDIPL